MADEHQPGSSPAKNAFHRSHRCSASYLEVCGRPLSGLRREPEEHSLCPACQDKTYAFARARSFALYENAVVRAILLLKFEPIEPLAKRLRLPHKAMLLVRARARTNKQVLSFRGALGVRAWRFCHTSSQPS